MPCYSPVPAWPDLNTREWVLSWSPKRELGAKIMRDCGQCEGCRRASSAGQALQCVHEARYHEASCFLTLTIDDAHFPHSDNEWRAMGLRFVKLLRRRWPGRIRTFGCRELGELTLRPHFHFLVFGRDFSRDEPMARGEAGGLVFRSDELDALWPHGHASVGDLTEQSAGYVARYAMKKRGLRDARGEFVAVPHPVTGQFVFLRPAAPIARSQSLGRQWFDEFGHQAIEQGAVIGRGGVRYAIPASYKRRAKALMPLAGADAECLAMERAKADEWNRTPERLAVRREVAAAKLRSLRRDTL